MPERGLRLFFDQREQFAFSLVTTALQKLKTFFTDRRFLILARLLLWAFDSKLA